MAKQALDIQRDSSDKASDLAEDKPKRCDDDDVQRPLHWVLVKELTVVPVNLSGGIHQSSHTTCTRARNRGAG